MRSAPRKKPINDQLSLSDFLDGLAARFPARYGVALARSEQAEGRHKLHSEPVVTTAAGGVMGGGTKVTPVGEKTIALYHSIEARTQAVAHSEFRAFRKLMRD